MRLAVHLQEGTSLCSMSSTSSLNGPLNAFREYSIREQNNSPGKFQSFRVGLTWILMLLVIDDVRKYLRASKYDLNVWRVDVLIDQVLASRFSRFLEGRCHVAMDTLRSKVNCSDVTCQEEDNIRFVNMRKDKDLDIAPTPSKSWSWLGFPLYYQE